MHTVFPNLLGGDVVGDCVSVFSALFGDRGVPMSFMPNPVIQAESDPPETGT